MILEQEEYRKIENKITSISTKYRRAEEVEEFKNHINSKLENFNPTIMIYGVYNAGKSTLLNAIFGQEEMAKTGDSPETAEISAYKYKGFTIYDTPGINAPIKHQEITDEHLSKSELILFVLSNNGSFEEEYIYLKIGEIIQSKKPLLIVMNNKSGIDMNSTEAQNEIIKVNQHIITICDKMGIEKPEEKVSIAFVDAKTALEGKTEDEQELINESKIEDLEQTIDNLLGKAGEKEVQNALNLYISNYITSTLSIIDTKIDNPQIRATQELITYLEKTKQRTYVELKDIITSSTILATTRLLELLLQRDEAGIKNLGEEIVQDINTKIQAKIKEIEKELILKIDNFKADFQELLLEAKDLNTHQELATEQASADSQSSNKTQSVVNTVSVPLLAAIPLVVPIGPIPIPAKAIATVLLGIYNIFAGSDEARVRAEAQMDMKRELHLSAKNSAESFSLDLKDKYTQNIEVILGKVFTGLLEAYISFSKKLEKEHSQLIEDKYKLQNIVDNLI